MEERHYFKKDLLSEKEAELMDVENLQPIHIAKNDTKGMAKGSSDKKISMNQPHPNRNQKLWFKTMEE